MDNFELRELRARLEAGDTLDRDEATALLDALDTARRAALTPSEYVVRVARAASDVERWEASHPLFRHAPSARHPADALALASVELRRALTDLDWPEARPPRLGGGAVDRAVADATRNETSGDVGAALAWALDELDRRSHERDAELTARTLRKRADAGDGEARATLRAEAIDRLHAVNVRTSRATWSSDGFGAAEDVGLALPCLAIALAAGDNERDLPGTFSADREWFALSHRVEPRPMSRYERAIVSPVTINDTGELALRRLAPRVPTGRSVAAYTAFRDVAAVELPGVDVGGITDRLSPAWVPLPMEARVGLCRGTPDDDLDVERLVRSDGFGPFVNWWRLVWITDDPGDSIY